ncbi:hypothetical protein KPH14_012084 [Odynerus spinipes]|uniref:MICOS complex subunit MIC13 n=1 Tax=Odynerus spinipes TaxID=1348599 RepID=A0AAD9R9U0_9HYME|nr:hypothetical protein KPH14_012084 [Odynerus spinipes]
MGVVRFTVKASLVGGIIYYTVQQGLWSNHDESLKLYEKINKNVVPYVKNHVPPEVIDEVSVIPSATDLTNYIKTSWNKGVIATMGFIQHQPSKLLQTSKDSLVELLEKVTSEKSE